ncbi:hypothetical protein [Nocardia veterana]|uniref:Uncharacterized protein n=1 Tax=Nocardia veterana TaxID=132249 RepID=A0A7X6LUZ4_9NOCA|nr:hypothetical protein [Nocardia veterana]NKY85065.1 hypothetical protein [Nocardia veterana]
MNAFIALIDSNSSGSVTMNSVLTNIMNMFITGSAGSNSNGGGIFN